MTSQNAVLRDQRIDLLRGIAVLIIFSDHVPGNVVAKYTPMAVELSDMAEVFVLLSGYTCGLSYGRRLVDRGFVDCQKRVCVRIGQIYAAKMIFAIIALLILLQLESVPPRFTGIPWSLELVKRNPLITLFHIETFQSGLFQYCVLDLYIVLLFCLPVVLVGLKLLPKVTIASSVILYVLSQLYPSSFRLPSPWREAVLFNPFAWQLIFFSASALATMKPELRTRLRPHWGVAIAALAVLCFAIAAHWTFQYKQILWTIKPNLEWLRMSHFVLVVILSWWVMPALSHVSRITLLQPLIRCGRNSLIAYCTVGVLGILGEATISRWKDSWTIQVMVNLVGWVTCIAVTCSCPLCAA